MRRARLVFGSVHDVHLRAVAEPRVNCGLEFEADNTFTFDVRESRQKKKMTEGNMLCHYIPWIVLRETKQYY